MELLNAGMTHKQYRKVKVLQFGEGNFLRGFVDYMIDIANECGEFDGDIVMVKPTNSGGLERFHAQDCQYTVVLRGMVNGDVKVSTRIITSVADVIDCYREYEKYNDFAKSEDLQFIVSNTTEAGILFDETDQFEMNPPQTYPGKLCKFLYERYLHFQGAIDKGLIILPVELIDDNGIHLQECVEQFAKLWNLEDGFLNWIEQACIFTSTLVDRIVTGYPRDEQESLCKEFGYQDNLIVTGEPFALWVIESKQDIRELLPLDRAGQPVIFTDNQKPYRQRKVRILNGAHTTSVLASFLSGNDFIRESIEDRLIETFMHRTIYDEVIPTLSLPENDLLEFAEAVDGRFRNPYIKHALLSISLNSVSKWRARCLPSLVGYLEKKGELPKHLTFSLAALMAFYTGTEIRGKDLIGIREGKEYRISDNMDVISFFAENSGKNTDEFTQAYLGRIDFHGQDLNQIPGLTDAVSKYLADIRTFGMRKAIEKNFER